MFEKIHKSQSYGQENQRCIQSGVSLSRGWMDENTGFSGFVDLCQSHLTLSAMVWQSLTLTSPKCIIMTHGGRKPCDFFDKA
jgi:hypothetical protein